MQIVASNTELSDITVTESDPVEITVVPIQDYSSSSRSQNANQSEKN